jgi:hypothetical protein
MMGRARHQKEEAEDKCKNAGAKEEEDSYKEEAKEGFKCS